MRIDDIYRHGYKYWRSQYYYQIVGEIIYRYVIDSDANFELGTVG